MAIQLDLSTSQYGVPFAGAYFRVVTAAVTLVMWIFADTTAH
jgi:hypothetical protein